MGMEDTRKKLFEDLEQYIQEHWIPEAAEESPAQSLMEETCLTEDSPPLYLKRKSSSAEDYESRKDISKGAPGDFSPAHAMSLEDLIQEVGKSFHESLFEMISESGMTDVEVYKRANIDRKLFSKIRSNPAYHPRKSTVVALAISMRLDMAETEELLASAEYAFSPGSKSDVIVRYFIERNVFDIHTINIALYEHGLPILE